MTLTADVTPEALAQELIKRCDPDDQHLEDIGYVIDILSDHHDRAVLNAIPQPTWLHAWNIYNKYHERGYRAAYYVARDGNQTILTGPEQAHLDDDALIEAAVREAYDADLIGEEYPRVTEETLRCGLRIGTWIE